MRKDSNQKCHKDGKKQTAMNEESQYNDIIDLPHHVSTVHPHMSLHDRAAQFLPFAALTGYKDAIKETERLTEEQYGEIFSETP